MIRVMSRSLSRQEIREVDRRAIEEFGVPGVVLMENAGRSATELLVDALGARGVAAIVCGKGNNAGDGFVMARHLANRGLEVDVLLAAPPETLTGDAAVFLTVLQRSGLVVRDLSRGSREEWREAILSRRPTWIVDALLGTGLSGPAREPFSTAIEAVNASGVPVLAVDLPSGLDCDTGVPAGVCVRAAHTGTFAARKKGFDNPASREWTGTVHVLDIGLPPPLHVETSSSERGADPRSE